MRTGLIGGLLLWGILIWVIIATNACGSTRGWQVGFGIYPVSQIANEQKLVEKETK